MTGRRLLDAPVPATADGAARARQAVRAAATGRAPSPAADRLETVAGELLANACEHGGPPVQVVLVEDVGGWCLRVRDGGRGTWSGEPPSRGAMAGRGRGLALVRALADATTVRGDEQGREVVVRVAPPRGRRRARRAAVASAAAGAGDGPARRV